MTYAVLIFRTKSTRSAPAAIAGPFDSQPSAVSFARNVDGAKVVPMYPPDLSTKKRLTRLLGRDL